MTCLPRKLVGHTFDVQHVQSILPTNVQTTMAIEFQDISESLRIVSINGRLDIPGTDEIATRFAALSATSARKIIVDLTGVTFLASIGIRSLIINAKACQQRGGTMFLLVGDNAQVASTLESTGIGALIPTFLTLAEAEKAAAA